MEIWRDVVGYEGLYQVSSFGNVRKIDGTILTGNIQDGYHRVGLTKNGKLKVIRTHRLVGEAFIPRLDTQDRINHKDLNRSNNHISNLEWCTAKENSIHAKENGAIPFGEYVKHSKLTNEQAIDIYKSNESTIKLAEKYNVPRSVVDHVRSNKGWSNIGNNSTPIKIRKTNQTEMPMGVSKYITKLGRCRYFARLNINKKSTHLGTFDTEDTAFKAVSDRFYEIYGFYPEKYQSNLKKIRKLT